MPFLNADALTSDPDGLAFLKAVLESPASDLTGAERPGQGMARRPRRRTERDSAERRPASTVAAPEDVAA